MVELVWSLVAFFGLVGTLIAMWLIGRSLMVIVAAIHQGQASWTGPRLKFCIGMFGVMAVLIPGWVAYLILGAISGSLPPRGYDPEDVAASAAFGWTLIAGELCFAAGQAGIFLVWLWVRRAPIFVPRVERRAPIHLGGD